MSLPKQQIARVESQILREVLHFLVYNLYKFSTLSTPITTTPTAMQTESQRDNLGVRSTTYTKPILHELETRFKFPPITIVSKCYL